MHSPACSVFTVLKMHAFAPLLGQHVLQILPGCAASCLVPFCPSEIEGNNLEAQSIPFTIWHSAFRLAVSA